MRRAEFLDIVYDTPAIAVLSQQYPDVKQDVDKFSNRMLVRLFLINAGEQIVNILIKILYNTLIKKYASKN